MRDRPLYIDAARLRSGRSIHLEIRRYLRGHPTVPSVAPGTAFVEVGHLHPRKVVLRDLLAFSVDVDAEDARGVESEDLRLHRGCQRSIAVPFHQGRRDLEASERLDLPLG